MCRWHREGPCSLGAPSRKLCSHQILLLTSSASHGLHGIQVISALYFLGGKGESVNVNHVAEASAVLRSPTPWTARVLGTKRHMNCPTMNGLGWPQLQIFWSVILQSGSQLGRTRVPAASVSVLREALDIHLVVPEASFWLLDTLAMHRPLGSAPTNGCRESGYECTSPLALHVGQL